ncbi:MAG: DUF1467 family protein [Alphaproteobacteria bacterium]
MIIVSGLLVYFLIWWVVLFAVLPMGVERQAEVQDGNDRGAPIVANMKKKIMVTSLISLLIWSVIFTLMQTGIISFNTINALIDL